MGRKCWDMSMVQAAGAHLICLQRNLPTDVITRGRSAHHHHAPPREGTGFPVVVAVQLLSREPIRSCA